MAHKSLRGIGKQPTSVTKKGKKSKLKQPQQKKKDKKGKGKGKGSPYKMLGEFSRKVPGDVQEDIKQAVAAAAEAEGAKVETVTAQSTPEGRESVEPQKAKLTKKRGRVATKPAGETEPDAADAGTSAQGEKAAKKQSKAEARAQALAEQQNQALYATEERILLVGEGNFSFGRALCRYLEDGSNVYATAYDNETTLNKKYPDAADYRKEIEQQFKGTTLVGVDATRLHKIKEFKGAFKKIVWNFPHIGSGETDVDKNIVQHRKLLADFFASAVQCLSDDRGAAVHVALKMGEPYKSWKIVQTARAALPAEFDLLTAVEFAPTAWEGYAHRRTLGFDSRVSKADSEELAKGAKVYVFGRRKQR